MTEAIYYFFSIFVTCIAGWLVGKKFNRLLQLAAQARKLVYIYFNIYAKALSMLLVISLVLITQTCYMLHCTCVRVFSMCACFLCHRPSEMTVLKI